jgi:LacI family repressor for deo operon, udp, cdd, tsx, nupC, and nupG
MATIKEIADKLGISVSTVSKGLNGAHDISESVRQQVLDTAVEMGYKSKRRDSEKKKKLCIFIENMDFESTNQFGYEIVLGFKQAAFKDQYSISVLPITKDFQRREKYDTYMLKNHISGAFIVGFALDDPWINDFRTTKFPTVLLDNFIPVNGKVGSIGTDSEEGIDMAIDHLFKLGHRKIAFLDGSINSTISDQRMEAYLKSMSAHNLTIDPDLAVYGYFVAESAKYHVPGFIEKGATAILCGNDLIATGCITECMSMGLSIPDDISIIGFDDIPIAQHLDPPLTTVRQNRLDLGKCGYCILYGILSSVPLSKNLLRPELIVRESTARARERISSSESGIVEKDSVALQNSALYKKELIKAELERRSNL